MNPIRYKDLQTDYGPQFETDLESVIAEVEQAVHGSVEAEGEKRAVRFAHAKAYGLLEGELEILEVADPSYAQGIFATPGRHRALVRYSNGLGHLGPDAHLGTACGMAIKIFGIPGPSLSDEPDAGTMDYNLINHPVFFANTARDYITISRLFNDLPGGLVDRSKRATWLHAFLTRDGQLPPEQWLWDELFAISSLFTVAMPNLLRTAYWSMGAVRHGDYVAKVRTLPTTRHPVDAARTVDLATSPGPEPVREALVEDARTEHTFDLQVQLCADLEAMPVENTSVPWSEKLSPFVTVARLTLPAQDVSGPDNLARADALSFTPWRTPAEHQPVGQIQTVRRRVYERSSILRHQLNSQPRKEPAGPDDVH
ncbi:catalase family protein [Actinospica sp.]|uniref:catalase family protein n=1 Tax=Actinospica sp. TaxID=1872142 RepID=UPI002C61DEE8|nr:catalase family protein [Actinospica sp.]HWG26445.1 catalase family protein [Actinospica sp.]